MADKILVIEDDPQLGAQIVEHLREAGFEPDWLTDGDTAWPAAASEYRLLILDLMLPGTYGLDVLKRLRAQSDLPVLILSARNDTADKIRALKLGADDYLTKPFWPGELIARVQARLRRPTLVREDRFERGGLRIDFAAREVAVEDRMIDLTRVEFDLLAALARRPGVAVTRGWLCDNVLDPERSGGASDERTLDVHVSRLRKKLGGKRWIVTVWGFGYRLEPDAD